MSRKVEVSSRREVFTYTEFWHTSYCLIELAKEDPKGSTHQFRASLVFTAFAFEAYLNHIGPKIFKSWDALERLSPKNKTNVIAEKIGVVVDFGQMPFQIIRELFKFRNDIAHGKSVVLEGKDIVALEKFNENPHYLELRTEWEQSCTLENAENSRVQIEAVVHILHEAAGIDGEYPFIHGLTVGGGSLIE